MKPGPIPNDFENKSVAEIIAYMRSRGFSFSAHQKPRQMASADDVKSNDTWNLSDVDMANWIGIAPNTFRKVMSDDPTVKLTTIRKVAVFYLEELEPASQLRYDWLNFIEQRWEACATPRDELENGGDDSAKSEKERSPDLRFGALRVNPSVRPRYVVALLLVFALAGFLSASLISFKETEEALANTDSVNLEISRIQRDEDLDKALDLALANIQSETNSRNRRILIGQIQAIQGRKESPGQDYAQLLEELESIEASLLQIRAFSNQDLIASARGALSQGDISVAKDVWVSVLEESTRNDSEISLRSSKAAWELSRIERTEFRWSEAADYLLLAAELDPNIENLSEAGALLWEIGDYRGAEKLERAALPLAESSYGSQSDEFAGSLSSLGLTLAAIGNFAEAEEMYVRALEIRRKILPEGSPSLLKTVSNYCNLLIAEERLEEALPLCNEALTQRTLSKDENPYGYAISLIVSSGLQQKTGNTNLARDYLETAAQIAHDDQAYWGPQSNRYAQAIFLLGLVLMEQRHLDEAESKIRESIEIVRSNNGDYAPDVYIREGYLAVLVAERGETREAIEFAENALKSLEFIFGDRQHPDVVDARLNLAAVNELSISK